MTTATVHTQGTFCWPELATSDAMAAKKFYGSLLGWNVRDTDMGPNGIYTVFLLGDRDAAACYTLTPQMQGVPPHWGAYVAVNDADQTAAKAESLGGKLVMKAFDVMDLGRMAVIQDPIGATFCVWQAKKHGGVAVMGQPGTLGWTQLNASTPERVKPFYTELFGWTFRDDPMPWGGTYTTWQRADGTQAGGMMPMPTDAQAPSHWLTYFTVQDIAKSHAQALSLGAKEFVPPTELGDGLKFSVLADPQGAAFGLMTSMAK